MYVLLGGTIVPWYLVPGTGTWFGTVHYLSPGTWYQVLTTYYHTYILVYSFLAQQHTRSVACRSADERLFILHFLSLTFAHNAAQTNNFVPTYIQQQLKKQMALRRPPTRIELKTDDIEEYEEVILY